MSGYEPDDEGFAWVASWVVSKIVLFIWRRFQSFWGRVFED